MPARTDRSPTCRRRAAILATLLATALAGTGRADPVDGLEGFAWGQVGADGDGWSGAGGVFVPLSAEGGTLSYLDARLRGGPDVATYGLGLGARGLVDEAWILGGSAFIDAHDLDAAGWHVRAGLQVEAMGPAWDARLTGYWGLSDVDRTLERRLGIAGGHADLYRDHAAYHGVEGEVGLRLDASDGQAREWRVFGGGYHAWRDGFEDRSGAFARLEFRHYDLDGLPAGSRLHAELEVDWRATDDAVGVAGFLRLRLPFQETGPAPGVPLGDRDRRFLDIARRDHGPAVGDRQVWIVHIDGADGSGIDIDDPSDLGIPACADYAGEPTGITYDLTGHEVTCVHYVAQGGVGNGATADQAAAYDDINTGTLLPDGALIVVLDTGGTIAPAA
ncbi:MAG: inverse autotransporter beta domain-containing protein, partial [Azospirillaceae bacterium]